MEKITCKQDKVLTFIKKFVVENGYPPSVREIGAGLGLITALYNVGTAFDSGTALRVVLLFLPLLASGA